MVYSLKGGVGGGAYIAQWSYTSIAIAYALQERRGTKIMNDSHNKA